MKKRVTNETINEHFESAEKEYTKIFNELLDVKSLGEGDGKALSRKLGFLSLGYYSHMEGLEAKLNKKYKCDKWLLIGSIFAFYLTYLLFLLTASHIAFLGTFLSVVLGVINAVDLRKVKTHINTFNRNKNNKDLMILIDNCNRLLEEKINKNYKSSKNSIIEKNYNSSLDNANVFLQNYLTNGFLPKLSEEDKNILIKMLQDDLKTDEIDLAKLLKMAKDKVTLDNVRDHSDLSRTLDKNDK